MILKTYEEVVRHLDKFPDKPLYIDVYGNKYRVIQVQYRGKEGMEVFTEPDKRWHCPAGVISPLTKEEFYPKIKKDKVKKGKKKNDNKSTTVVGEGKVRVWL